MDLMEAEGLGDLIDAETSPAKNAGHPPRCKGRLSGYYDSLRELISRALARLEASIDFPDEEIPAVGD